MQLLVVRNVFEVGGISRSLGADAIPVNPSRHKALAWSSTKTPAIPRPSACSPFAEDPGVFVDVVRPALRAHGPALEIRQQMTMFGRTYSTGYEQDLDLLDSCGAR